MRGRTQEELSGLKEELQKDVREIIALSISRTLHARMNGLSSNQLISKTTIPSETRHHQQLLDTTQSCYHQVSYYNSPKLYGIRQRMCNRVHLCTGRTRLNKNILSRVPLIIHRPLQESPGSNSSTWNEHRNCTSSKIGGKHEFHAPLRLEWTTEASKIHSRIPSPPQSRPRQHGSQAEGSLTKLDL